MTGVGLEQIPVFSWINCTPDWWGPWFHPQWLWREPRMSPAQAVHSHCWQVITLADTASDLLSVSVAETRKELRSLEFESCSHPSPPLTTGRLYCLVWNSGYPVHFSIQMHSLGIFPHFCCFPAKLMRFDFHWESSRKTKVASVAEYPVSIGGETSPLALVGQGAMNMTWKGQIPRGLCRGLFTWSIIH